eukprot:357319-Hanusia_phi.AAC.3
MRRSRVVTSCSVRAGAGETFASFGRLHEPGGYEGAGGAGDSPAAGGKGIPHLPLFPLQLQLPLLPASSPPPSPYSSRVQRKVEAFNEDREKLNAEVPHPRPARGQVTSTRSIGCETCCGLLRTSGR